MGKLYAYSHTAAGIARRAREREPVPAVPQPPKPETPPAQSPVAENVVKLVIPRTEAQQIIYGVARKHGVTYADIMGPSRSHKVIAARFDAIAAVRIAKPDFTMGQLGRIFRRDHTSALNALRKRGLA